MQKFSLNSYVYYINPYVFTIEVVFLCFTDFDEIGNRFYIEETGAYLEEKDLAETIEDARGKALNYLNNFYNKKIKEINNEIVI